jgi:hypothetical protein
MYRKFDPHRPYQNNHNTKHLALKICRFRMSRPAQDAGQSIE